MRSLSPPCGGVPAGPAKYRRPAVHPSGSASFRSTSRPRTNTDAHSQRSAGMTQERRISSGIQSSIYENSCVYLSIYRLWCLNYHYNVSYQYRYLGQIGPFCSAFAFSQQNRYPGTWLVHFCFISWQVSQTEVQQGQQQFNQFTDGQVRFRVFPSLSQYHT